MAISLSVRVNGGTARDFNLSSTDSIENIFDSANFDSFENLFKEVRADGSDEVVLLGTIGEHTVSLEGVCEEKYVSKYTLIALKDMFKELGSGDQLFLKNKDLTSFYVYSGSINRL